jgi:hypothetical protein
MRALHGRGTLRVPDIGREASRPYNKTIFWLTLYEIINNSAVWDGEPWMLTLP